MTPVRLDKKPENNHFDSANFFCNSNLKNRAEAWCIRHASLCMLISIIVFLLAFVVLCFALCGASATEANNYYYHIGGVI